MPQVSQHDPNYIYQNVFNGVWYNELNKDSGEAHFDFSPDTLSTTTSTILICDWEARYLLINSFRNLEHPTIKYCFAETFDLKPSGLPLGLGTWQYAHIEVGYRTLFFDPTDLKEVHVKTRSQSITLPAAAMEFQDEENNDPSSQSLPIDPAIPIAFQDIAVTLHLQSTIDEPTWDSCKNCVNQSAINVVGPGGLTWPAGHLLYLGWDIDEKFTSGGKIFEVTHNFLGAPVDHRKEFNPSTGDFELVSTKVGGNFKFGQADFNQLAGVNTLPQGPPGV